MSAFSAAIATLFRDPNLTQAAELIASDDSRTTITVMASRADAVTNFGDGRIWRETMQVDLETASGVRPRPGNRIEIGGEVYRVQGEPVREKRRLVWTVDLAPDS